MPRFHTIKGRTKLYETVASLSRDCAHLAMGNLFLTNEFRNATEHDFLIAVTRIDNKELVKQILKIGVDPAARNNKP